MINKISNFYHVNQKKIDLSLLIIILLSIFFVIIESIPEYSVKLSRFFYVSKWIFTSIFLIEYIIRLITSKNPLKYIFSLSG